MQDELNFWLFCYKMQKFFDHMKTNLTTFKTNLKKKKVLLLASNYSIESSRDEMTLLKQLCKALKLACFLPFQ